MSDLRKMSGMETKLYGVLAEYDSPGDLVAAAAKVRDAGYKKWDCHSPFPVHGLDPAMGTRMTILPLIVFGGGLTGLLGGLALQWWANAYQWPWIISGKPFFSLPAQIPIIFECTVLLSAFAAFFGMWGLNRLPQVWHPLFKKDQFLKVSDDGFFIAIEAEDGQFEQSKTEALLKEAGALSVDSCEYETGRAKRKMPKAIGGFILVSSMIAVLPLAFVVNARVKTSDKPHYHVVPNMDFQPKYKSQKPGKGLPGIFAEGPVSRPSPAGTVARGELWANLSIYRGIELVSSDDGGQATRQWVTSFPIDVDEKTMARGQELFGIYCRPCHGDTGDGKGMVNQRAIAVGANATGWNAPTNLTDDSVVRQPHGQIFNTITHGIRTMTGYGSQIVAEDRWAVVLYLRALQRSRKTELSDVPPALRQTLR